MTEPENPKSNTASDSKSWANLGITARDAFRFAFGGIATVLVSYLLYPEKTRDFAGVVGSVGMLAVVVAAGSLLYASYRPLLLECILQRLALWLHFYFDEAAVLFSSEHCRSKIKTSTFAYLQDLKVGCRHYFFAWRAIMDHFLEKHDEKQSSRLRSARDQVVYLHLVGTLCLGTGSAMCLGLLKNHQSPISEGSWLWIGAGFWFLGILSDVNIEKVTYDAVLAINKEEELKQLLIRLKYLPGDTPPKTSESNAINETTVISSRGNLDDPAAG